jgi:hypothetical protein
VGFEPTTRGLKVSPAVVHGVLRLRSMATACVSAVHRLHRGVRRRTAVAVTVAVTAHDSSRWCGPPTQPAPGVDSQHREWTAVGRTEVALVLEIAEWRREIAAPERGREKQQGPRRGSLREVSQHAGEGDHVPAHSVAARETHTEHLASPTGAYVERGTARFSKSICCRRPCWFRLSAAGQSLRSVE